MKEVMWILVNDDNRIIEQVLLPEIAEEQAIDEFAVRLRLQGIEGKFKIGYITADGQQHMNIYKQIFGNPDKTSRDDSERE